MTNMPLVFTLFVVASTLPGCATSNRNNQASEEPVTLNVTSWTPRTELYMEYPPLVTNEQARFAVHLTTLNDFKALNAGRPSVEMVPENGGAPIKFAGSDALRPGAFRVEMTPPAAGRYRWSLDVQAPGLTDRHDLGTITVYPDTKTAAAQVKAPEEDATAFAYLKEQQWTNEFATELVREADLRATIRAPASIDAMTGGEAVVSAPAAGRFTATRLPSIGDVVRSGQVLGALEPRLGTLSDRSTLVGEASEAQVSVDAARVDAERAERLLAEQAVPARRVEDARRTLAIAETRLKAAQARLAQRDETLRSGGGGAGGNAFVLRAPLSGRIVDVRATLGASYDEGAVLFEIVRTDRVELRAHVPAADASSIRDVETMAFEIPGQEPPVPLKPEHMHDAGVLDPTTRALAVQFEVANPGGRLFIGQNGTVTLHLRRRLRMTAVSKSAVLMEAGRPFVFVQVGGERFARRLVEIAARDGDLVGISTGVKPGDRVVVRGAYEVQLASAAKGLPAEGHVH